MKGLRPGKVAEDSILTLAGTMRGYERDRMATADGVLARFTTDSPAAARPGTVYLVCTSAGEVGVDISADHLVCDPSTFESMARRFGRVNGYGTRAGTEVHVVHPTGFTDDEYDQRRERTPSLLRQLGDDASPAALGGLDPAARLAAFAPAPPILPTSDILFDARALTTVAGKLPGRPAVEPYLHGLPTDRPPPEPSVAWREEVGRLDARPWDEWEPKAFDRYAAGGDRRPLVQVLLGSPRPTGRGRVIAGRPSARTTTRTWFTAPTKQAAADVRVGPPGNAERRNPCGPRRFG